MEDEILYRRAAARVEIQLGFYRHVMIYIVVNVLLAGLNLLKNPHHLWFQWVILGWGIGLLAWPERLLLPLVRIAPGTDDPTRTGKAETDAAPWVMRDSERVREQNRRAFRFLVGRSIFRLCKQRFPLDI